MSRFWAAVRSNPVRTWAYGVVLPVFGVLLVYGVVSENQAAAWISLAYGILHVPGTEWVRSKVTPASGGTMPPAQTPPGYWSRFEESPTLTPRVPVDPDPPRPRGDGGFASPWLTILIAVLVVLAILALLGVRFTITAH